jgi:hypothetical protein
MSLNVFNLLNPAGLNVALGLTELLTRMSIRNLSGDKAKAMHNPDITAICEPTV